MIAPTVGRVLWYYPSPADFTSSTMQCISREQPLAATVAYVCNDRSVNLCVTDHKGSQHARTNVLLLQGDEQYTPVGAHATWMPYQVGQAKKDAA